MGQLNTTKWGYLRETKEAAKSRNRSKDRFALYRV